MCLPDKPVRATCTGTILIEQQLRTGLVNAGHPPALCLWDTEVTHWSVLVTRRHQRYSAKKTG